MNKSDPQKVKKFINYCNNKNICLIGSGSSILKNKYGQEIENHDIIIRINRGYPYKRYREYVGSRTDVWSFGMGGEIKLRQKMHELMSDRKYSLYPWWDHSWVQKDIAGLDNHVFLPPESSLQAANLCGGNPATTGIDTIYFLSNYVTFSTLSIYGVDFYTTGYWFYEEDSSIKPTVVTNSKQIAHNSTKERQLLENLLKKCSKIKWIK